MPRRKPSPHGENDFIPPSTPKPVTYIDAIGREWLATWLNKSPISPTLGECRPCDASHRGFAFEKIRLVYRIRQGEERSDDHETVRRHFECARRVTKTFADVEAARANDHAPPMSSRIQDVYDKRGMGKR